MKRTIKIIIVMIVLFYTIPNINYYYQSLITVFISIPKEYKSYKTLDSLTSNSEYTIKNFESIYDERPFRVNDSTICISTHTIIDTINHPYATCLHLYKIDKLGNAFDSLSVKDEDIYQANKYLINRKEDYYSTWLIDGDTTRKPLNLIGNGKVFNKEEFKKHTALSDYVNYIHIEDSVTKKHL